MDGSGLHYKQVGADGIWGGGGADGDECSMVMQGLLQGRQEKHDVG